MKRTVIIALSIAAVPTAASAEHVIASFDNFGQCVAAWTHLNNADWQLETRESERMVGQGNWVDHYRCRRSGDRWLKFWRRAESL